MYNTPEWDKVFKNIIEDIEEQQCVLLIGPEVVGIEGGKSFHQALKEQLYENNREDIAHYYPRDEFFLFRDKVAKEDVQREVRRYYKRNSTESNIDETVFKHLARMPFHLILSINPDSFLSDVCYKYGIRHRFSFFHHRGDAVPEVEPPTKSLPLIYNLFGSNQQDDSLVLDYEDLFRLIKTMLGTPGLPEKLLRALQKSKTFLFLGFDFEKWYSQLLLRLLVGEKAIKKFAVNTDIADADTRTFLVQQFDIQFLGNEKAFFDELYRRCEEDGSLRLLNNANSSIAVNIIRHIQNGEINQAITILCQKTEGAQKIDALHLSARYNHLEDQKLRGLIDMRDYFVEYNRVVDLALELTKYVPS